MRKKQWRTLIAESGLSPDIQKLIRDVVKRSRLWSSERRSLAIELVAHFADGLDAGRSADDLLKTFGDPKITARLVRRAKKRNRPIWWRFGRRLVQAMGIFVVLYLGQMVILLMGHPSPKVDYLAADYANAEAVPVADRAWPIYQIALQADPINKKPIRFEPTGGHGGSMNAIWPGDAAWPEVVAVVRQHAGLVEAARLGATKPVLGITRDDQIREGRRPPASIAALATGSIATAQCADSVMFQFATLLHLDLKVAASEGDADRVVANYRSSLEMVRQLRESRTVEGQVVSLVIVDRADTQIREANRRYPVLLSSRQFLELSQAMADSSLVAPPSLRREREFMLDLIQRGYTDDGQGDGRLTREGIEYFAWVRFLDHWGDRTGSTMVTACLPLLWAGMASRKEMTRATNELYDILESAQHRPLAHSKADEDAVDNAIRRICSSVHYAPFMYFHPYFISYGDNAQMLRARHDALRTALALEAYQRESGGYPRELEQLVPRYLPAIPLDAYANRPMRYALHDGKPVIYACGRDGKDRGGVLPKGWQQGVPENEDWVLYPLPPLR